MSEDGTEMSTTYKIGQILYILQNESAQVAPVQIAKEVIENTLNGSEVSYIVQFFNAKKERVLLDLKKINGEVFTSPEKLKKVLIARVSATMNQIVITATEKASSDFKEQVSVEKEKVVAGALENDEEVHQIEQEGFANVTLPDGSKARVKLNV